MEHRTSAPPRFDAPIRRDRSCTFDLRPRGGLGLFARAADLRDAARRSRGLGMTRRDGREFCEIRDWLWKRTPVPPEFAYIDDRCRRPLTWWKVSAHEHVHRAWRLSVIMARYGYRVLPRRSRWPGTILFEDDVQVVVRPDRRHDRWAAKVARREPRWDGDRATTRGFRRGEIFV